MDGRTKKKNGDNRYDKERKQLSEKSKKNWTL